jgi:TolB protein
MYEMLSGKRAFPGRTIFELADAIRTKEPDFAALPKDTPDALRTLIKQCLVKDREKRLAKAADVRATLEHVTGDLAPITRQSARAVRMALGVAAAAVVVAAGVVVYSRNSAASAVNAASIRLTQFTSGEGVEQSPAWAPDGRTIVFAQDVGPIRKLFIRNVGSDDVAQLTSGDRDDLQPAFSADGRSVYFVRARAAGDRVEPGDVFSSFEPNEGDIWVVDIATRVERKLIDNAYSPDISPDGQAIAFDARRDGQQRIYRATMTGQQEQRVTSDSSEAIHHIRPRWSPDGKRLVYQRVERTRFDIAIVDAATQQSRIVTRDAYRKIQPAWARDGRAIFYSSDAGGGMNIWRLALDRNANPVGTAQQVTTGAGQDLQVAPAPDGDRFAFTTLHQNADLWVLPLTPEGALAGEPRQLVATTREDSRGAWSPDSKSIAFNSDRSGTMNLWLYNVGDGSTRQLTRGAGGDFQPTWSPDGKTLVFFSGRGGKSDADIWTLDVASGTLTQRTTRESIDINPFYSPDGRQILFQSDASGRLELWVMNADGTGLRQLTTIGVSGHFMRWRDDGNIYFRSPNTPGLLRMSQNGGTPQVVAPFSGAHLSFAPRGDRFIDVKGHKELWMIPLGTDGAKLFEFTDADARIDYPVWSPDGKWLVFDWFKPSGGDLWTASGLKAR